MCAFNIVEYFILFRVKKNGDKRQKLVCHELRTKGVMYAGVT